MAQGTLERWEAAIARAVALLSRDLDAPPSLRDLAAAAGVSPFHFHRIWRAMTGETIGETIRRLKLESAAHALGESDRSVSDIGLSAGFATPQAFARAFRRQLGLSPSGFRTGEQPAWTPPAGDVEIVWKDPVTIIAKRRTGGGYRELNGEFQAVWDWATAQGLIERMQGIYGIPYDDPESVPESELRYDAGFDFGELATPGNGLHAVRIAGGPYARLRVLGSYDNLEPATQYLLGDWLLLSGREPSDAPLFHNALTDPDVVAEPDLVTDVYLPLRAVEGERE